MRSRPCRPRALFLIQVCVRLNCYENIICSEGSVVHVHKESVYKKKDGKMYISVHVISIIIAVIHSCEVKLKVSEKLQIPN